MRAVMCAGYVCVALVCCWAAAASSVLDDYDYSELHDAPAEQDHISSYLYSEPYVRAGKERITELTEYTSLESLKGLSDQQIWERLTEGRKKKPTRSTQNKLTDRYTDVMFGDSTHSDQGHVNNDLTNFKASQNNIVSADLFDNETLLQSSDGVGGELGRQIPVKVVNKRKTVSEQKDDEDSSSLAFVFDTTGSMWDDLVQVRHGAAKILDTMLTRADRPVSHYVLVPFHDPRKYPVHTISCFIICLYVFRFSSERKMCWIS